MRKLWLIPALLLLLCSNAHAQAISSGVTTGVTFPAYGTIVKGPCLVTAATVICNGTTDTDLWVLDSGVTKIVVRAEGTTMPSYRKDFRYPLYFETNCEIRIIGATGKAIIEYIPK